MLQKTYDKRIGTIEILLSAILFSLGGILIKIIPWHSISINSARSFFALIILVVYMMLMKHRFVFNASVVLGAVFNTVMSLTFVIATKMTSAANAIVLQFTEPIFVILLLWIIFKEKPEKKAVYTCIVAFLGIICFFFEKLTPGGMTGNIVAIFSGFSYAFVFLIKRIPHSDFESSLVISYVVNILLGIPYFAKESNFSMSVLVAAFVLGVFQFGISYILLSRGLNKVSAFTASVTSMVEPILNPIIVAVFYGERMGCLSLLGAVLVIGSAVYYNISVSVRQ